MFVSVTEVALSISPCLALMLSQFAWKQSQGVTGWMLGNWKELQLREGQGWIRHSPGLEQKSKKAGEKKKKIDSIAGTVLWECWWGRDHFYSVPQSGPTSSTVDVWAICAQHACRATEHELLWRLAVCVISYAWWENEDSYSDPAKTWYLWYIFKLNKLNGVSLKFRNRESV